LIELWMWIMMNQSPEHALFGLKMVLFLVGHIHNLIFLKLNPQQHVFLLNQ